MTLFDRKVDLARFTEDTSLYVMCRDWMKNNLSPEEESLANVVHGSHLVKVALGCDGVYVIMISNSIYNCLTFNGLQCLLTTLSTVVHVIYNCYTVVWSCKVMLACYKAHMICVQSSHDAQLT